MQERKISVIVPVYNGEKTIKRCLQSILSSTYKNIEVIVVNDGSTDDTCRIVTKLQERYPNIHLENVVHGGAASAKNKGLELVSGEYFIYADADDCIQKDALRKMSILALRYQADILCGTYYRVQNKQRTKVELPVKNAYLSKNGEKVPRENLNRMKMHDAFGYTWNKLHRTAFFREAKIRFEDSSAINLEDNLFYINIMMKQPNYYVVDIPVTNYMIQPGSLTRRYDKGYVDKSIHTMQHAYCFLKEGTNQDERMELVAPLFWRLYLFSLVRNFRFEEKRGKTLKENHLRFMKNREFCEVMRSKASQKALKSIEDKRLRIGFCVCSMLIRHKLEWIYLFGIYLLNPVFNRLLVKYFS